MRYVVTADEMRALDAETIESIGLPGAVLMEQAGRGVAEVVARDLGSPGATVAVACGAGNNGGDGYVIARWLREWGHDAVVYLAAPRVKVGGDALLHLQVYERCGGRVVAIDDDASLTVARPALAAADVVVDAVFGTGLQREVQGHYRTVIEAINEAGGRRVAVDLPSGLSADDGQVLGVAVAADATVTMAFEKIAHVSAPGFVRCGAVSVVDIGIPRALAAGRDIGAGIVEGGDARAWLPATAATAHKNRRGHALVVAGSPGKRGAARLTSWAALRCGAGLVTLGGVRGTGELWAPDPLMTEELDPEGDVAARLRGLADGKQAVAIGPGMATGEPGAEMVRTVLELEVPMVLDADALNHVASDRLGGLEVVRRAGGPVVLTPHPGEAARLLGCAAREVEADRLAAVRALARRSGAVAVLKGARTLVCDGRAGHFVSINVTGGPALATAGSGDVLTGMIAAYLAQGVDAFDAARLAVYVHGLAGQQAAARLSETGVTASDVVDAIAPAVRSLA